MGRGTGRPLKRLVPAMKSFLKRFLPLGALEFLRSARRPRHSLSLLVLRRRFRRLNRGAVANTLTLRKGFTVLVQAPAREGFEAYCWWWPEMVKELDYFLDLSRTRRVLLDIGALHGIFSLAFAYERPEVMAVAIDPSPEACAIVAAHAAANRLSNIAVVNRALGDRVMTLDMVPHAHHLEVLAAGAVDGRKVLNIPVTTVDLLSDEMAIHPDIVKIDVEGYELHVLQGATRVLSTDRPDIMLELHPDRLRAYGGSVSELIALLLGHGYQVRDLRGKSIDAGVFGDAGGKWMHLICTMRPDRTS